jgi:hypothetical protein
MPASAAGRRNKGRGSGGAFRPIQEACPQALPGGETGAGGVALLAGRYANSEHVTGHGFTSVVLPAFGGTGRRCHPRQASEPGRATPRAGTRLLDWVRNLPEGGSAPSSLSDTRSRSSRAPRASCGPPEPPATSPAASSWSPAPAPPSNPEEQTPDTAPGRAPQHPLPAPGPLLWGPCLRPAPFRAAGRELWTWVRPRRVPAGLAGPWLPDRVERILRILRRYGYPLVICWRVCSRHSAVLLGSLKGDWYARLPGCRAGVRRGLDYSRRRALGAPGVLRQAVDR